MCRRRPGRPTDGARDRCTLRIHGPTLRVATGERIAFASRVPGMGWSCTRAFE